MTAEELHAADRRHLWHPYTDMAAHARAPFLCIDRADGATLYTADGRELLDGIASWWSVALGHGHPQIVAAIQRQAAVLQNAILGTLSHAPAAALAARLAAWAGGGLDHVYFASDGSSAVEAALKMARQYWLYRGEPQRTRFVSLEDAYHGDTLGAIGVGFTPWFQAPYGDLVVHALRAPSPHCRGAADAAAQEAHADAAFARMAELVHAHAASIAAAIIEPLCQGAAGIRIYPARYLARLRALCDETGILLIADEIATGFGRTGMRFACDHAGIAPDILCVGKALTGGYLPLSAALANARVYEAFLGGPGESRVFWDGHTFCGNPIAAAAALAALDAFDGEDVIARSAPLAQQLAQGFAHIARREAVAYHRSLGAIGMCALRAEAGGAAAAARAADRALDAGLFIRPLGEVLYLWPPLTATADEAARMIDALDEAIGGALRARA